MQRKFTFSLVVSSLLVSALYADTNAMSQNLAGAESTEGMGLLDKIFPQNQDPYNAKTYQLGAVEITAPQQADSNPTVTIVSKDEIDKTGSLDVGQALRFTPGVFYSPAENSTSPNTIYIRGFTEEEIGYYYDGIPINDIYAGNAAGDTDLMPFITFGLSEIQISKGYTSPAFSSGKLGGAVNMVSSIPVKDLEFNAKYQFISNNENRTSLQVGRNFGSDYFQLTFSHFQRKSLNRSYDYNGEGPEPIPNSSYRSYMLTGKYGFVFDNHEYSANFYHQSARRGDPSVQFSFPYYDKTAFYLLGNSNFGLVSLNSKVWYHMNLNQSGKFGTTWSKKYDDYTIGLTESL